MTETFSASNAKECTRCGREHQRADAVICLACARGPPRSHCASCYASIAPGDGVCDICKNGPRCRSCLSDLPHSLFPTIECLRCYDWTGQAEKCQRCSRNFLATDGCLQRCHGCWSDDLAVTLREIASEAVCFTCGIFSIALLTFRFPAQRLVRISSQHLLVRSRKPRLSGPSADVCILW